MLYRQLVYKARCDRRIAKDCYRKIEEVVSALECPTGTELGTFADKPEQTIVEWFGGWSRTTRLLRHGAHRVTHRRWTRDENGHVSCPACRDVDTANGGDQ